MNRVRGKFVIIPEFMIVTPNTSPATFFRTSNKKYVEKQKKRGEKLYPNE